MDRREFLRHAGFFTVAAASGRAMAAPKEGGAWDGRTDAVAHLFPQGVATGDPTERSVVFWTRCVRADGRAAPVQLTLTVAADQQFNLPVASVPLVASARFDHTVRVKLTQLEPGRHYYYRFAAAGEVSPTGRTKTAPARTSTPAQIRFAWFNCQDWSVNHWGAMSLMLQEEFDFLVHVGDYIYETVGAAFQAGAAEPAHGPISLPGGATLADGTSYAATLADYRTLYRTYRSDPRLQALHGRFPAIVTWDDHEFSDDAWQDHQTYTNQNRKQTARRRAANQAWVEYMPVDFGDVSFDSASAVYDNLRIYRDFTFGKLVHLVVTDERLYRDDHVVPEAAVALAQGHDPVKGSDPIGARYFVPLAVLQQFEAARTAALGRPPSILGVTQTQWWKQTLRNSTAIWKIWGNELMLSRLWADLSALAPPPYNALYVAACDSWDGFPSHRAELMRFLKDERIDNVVAVTGDLHAFQCGVVRDIPDPASGTPVLVDFVAAGISSTSLYRSVKAVAEGTPLASVAETPEQFDALLRANNPDLAYADHDAQGYASAVVTPTSLVVTFNKALPLNGDGTAPVSPLAKRTRITLLAGTRQPIVEDNV